MVADWPGLIGSFFTSLFYTELGIPIFIISSTNMEFNFAIPIVMTNEELVLQQF